jgi:hypothetical protein
VTGFGDNLRASCNAKQYDPKDVSRVMLFDQFRPKEDAQGKNIPYEKQR